ncbi:hypothetical protein RUMLAC_02098 [[Ruminococcus] lactaris ATCC 29176]|uniref:Uncharacterized protein n=1 Tax=[Ruminococcus] lactaris ATCC 29176 TaxID=471875 RepID=B5CRJ7_9FIRM|nr:hypothetical protein RUMLAC_02098 [[Ruminococcus] lactaris ATCC 29176]
MPFLSDIISTGFLFYHKSDELYRKKRNPMIFLIPSKDKKKIMGFSFALVL